MSQETTSYVSTPALRPKPQRALTASHGSWLVWLGIAVIAVGIGAIALLFVSLRSEQAAYEALMNGPTVLGRVIDKRTVVVQDGDVQSGTTTNITRYIFVYQYEVGAAQYTAESTVTNLAAYDRISIGNPIMVRYAANNPALECIASDCPLAPGVGLGYVLYLIPLIGLVIVWFGWRWRQKMRRFLSQAQTAPAIILDRWTDEHTDGEGGTTTRYCIAYQFDFSGLDGQNQRVIRSEYNQTAYQRWEIGDQASVRFLPAKPQFCILEIT
jgi:hypothetical protein